MRRENTKAVQSCRQQRGRGGAFLAPREKESALVAKSLNLVRHNLQTAINRELDLVISSYIEVCKNACFLIFVSVFEKRDYN
jgi:hypothetical protein